MQRWRRRLYRRVVKMQASPHAVALGMALGVLFGTLMPPGLQLITSIPIALLCGASAVAAFAGTLVSNPVTYVPLYYFTCRVGERVLQLLGSPVDLGHGLRSLLERAARLDFSEAVAAVEPLLASWAVGGFVIGMALAVPTYAFTYLVVVEIHRLREFARSRRAARHRALAEKDAPRTHADRHEGAPGGGERANGQRTE